MSTTVKRIVRSHNSYILGYSDLNFAKNQQVDRTNRKKA